MHLRCKVNAVNREIRKTTSAIDREWFEEHSERQVVATPAHAERVIKTINKEPETLPEKTTPGSLPPIKTST